jgi:hypothetical protein
LEINPQKYKFSLRVVSLLFPVSLLVSQRNVAATKLKANPIDFTGFAFNLVTVELANDKFLPWLQGITFQLIQFFDFFHWYTTMTL